jgi:RNA polymerase sigma-70 factor (ECF subfamily)
MMSSWDRPAPAGVDPIARAQGGDEGAFGALTGPYVPELQLHCYRMLGSLEDAEDALQETLLSAWRGLADFSGRASLRTWLYRIATNTCLNTIRTKRRRPVKAWDIPGVVPPEPTRLGEISWLAPLPDSLLEPTTDLPVGPEARYEQVESIALTFLAALQALPPQQLAVLVLRDVMGFRAREVAAMLETTVPSVNSALHRARSRLASHRPALRAGAPAPAGTEEDLATRFARAYESSDVAALLELFTDDVFLSMPPLPLEYVGRSAAGRFFALLLDSDRRYSLVPTRANGCPAWGAYVLGPDGVRRASGLFVVEVTGERIGALTRFEVGELARFGLPATLGGT